MSVADSLIAGESIVFESKKHWMAPIRASLVAAAMFVGGLILYNIAPNPDGILSFVGTILDLVAFGLIIGGIGWIIYNVLAWRTAEFAVTNMRVLREEGRSRSGARRRCCRRSATSARMSASSVGGSATATSSC